MDRDVIPEDILAVEREVLNGHCPPSLWPDSVIPLNGRLSDPLQTLHALCRGIEAHFGVEVPIFYGDTFVTVAERVKEALLEKNARLGRTG